MMDYSDWLDIPDNLRKDDWNWSRCELPQRNADLVLSLQPASVDEVGVGGGHLAKRLIESGVNYLGVDKSTACLALAKERCPEFVGVQSDAREMYRNALVTAGAECVVSFAVTKHFAPQEWSDILRKILFLGRRYAAFDVLISSSGRFEDTGTDWPHTWAPLTELLRALEPDWTMLSASAIYSGPAGYELLVTAERRTAA